MIAGELDVLFFVVAFPAVIVAGAAKAGFGGSGAFVATPFIALLLPPADALGVVLPLLIAIDLMTLRPYWRKWSVVDARAMIVASVLGVAVGWAIFDYLDPSMVKVAIGAIAMIFVILRVAQLVGWRPAPRSAYDVRRTGGWGFVAGLTSFVAHSGGPPGAMALIPRNLDKTVYQATTVIVFSVVNLAKLAPYLALGLIDGENLGVSVALLPAAVLGVVLGVAGHHHLPQKAFDIVVIVGLTGAGGKLLVDGLQALLAA